MTADLRKCPVCISAGTDAIDTQLYRCRTCGIAYNAAYETKPYSDRYFIEEYKEQYGRTYVEDFEAIYAASKMRLSRLLKYLKSNAPIESLSLLDIGSAAGFFLKCARDLGIPHVNGIEISEYASRYCRKQLNIPVIRASFTEINVDEQFDIITAWYFIEHCEDPVAVIRKIYGMLAPGGIFAFSCPSIFGPLFTFDRAAWIRAHPTDHRIDFSPIGAKQILKKCGFSKVHTLSSGIHPERVLSAGSVWYRPFSLVYKLFSHMTSFSDTMEVYAIK